MKAIKLKEGQNLNSTPNSPIISIVGKGASTYLWVGNNAEGDKMCFATLSGVKTLEKLACGILTSLGHNATSIKKNIYKKSKPINQ